MDKELSDSHLGKTVEYTSIYTPELLHAIPRQGARAELDVPKPLPFHGGDLWNAYELSWLNEKGKPEVGMATFYFSCVSPNIVESKSFKLYLNSFNNTRFNSRKAVKDALTHDLTEAAGEEVTVMLLTAQDCEGQALKRFDGVCLDNLDVECDIYDTDLSLLKINEGVLKQETLYSDLLKSNCPVTGQPDWGSVQIKYRGMKINHESLLKYIVSFRNHNEFHEQCVERIFMDIMRQCKPDSLTVYARYTRRGGLDINPIRSTSQLEGLNNLRHFRQ